MRYYKSQRGVTATGAIIATFIAAMLVMVTLVFGKPYMLSIFFNNEFKDVTKSSIKYSDATYIGKIRQLAYDKGFKLLEEDILIERPDRLTLSVDVTYYAEINIPFKGKKIIKFETSTTQELERSRRKAYKDDDDFDPEEEEEEKGIFTKIKELIGII